MLKKIDLVLILLDLRFGGHSTLMQYVSMMKVKRGGHERRKKVS